MNYYPHHIGDYLRDTAHLSVIEDGIYRRLIDLYYLQEKPLTIDINQICRLIRISTKKEKILTKKILNEFFMQSELFFIHTRCDIEIAKFKYKGTKARDSANARWQPINAKKNNDADALETQCERNANAMRNGCESDANQNQEPITNNHIKNITQKNEFFADIDNEILMQWIAVRTKKRAAKLSKIVYDAMVRESGIANITLEQAVIVCVERSWIAFKAEWYQNSNGQNKPASYNKGYAMTDESFDKWVNGEKTERIVNHDG